MADKQIRATAKLFLDTTNAANDAKQFFADLKKYMDSAEKSGSKFDVFKELGEYISDIDAKLNALKNKNESAFNHMFDGLDANLHKQIQNALSGAQKLVDEFESLNNQIIQTRNLKTSLGDAMKVANQFNAGEMVDGIAKTEKEVLELVSVFKTLHTYINDPKVDKSSLQYYEKLVQYMKAAAQLAGSYSIYTDGDAKFDIVDKAKRKDFVNAAKIAESYIMDIDKKFGNAVGKALDGIISNFESKIKNLKLEIPKTQEPTLKQSKQVEENKKLASSYDDLKNKLRELAQAQAKFDDGQTVDDDGVDLEDKIDSLNEYIVALDKTGSKEKEIAQIIEDFSFGDIDENNALTKLCDVLQIEVPQAVQKAESAVENFSNVASSNIKNAIIAIKNSIAELNKADLEGERLYPERSVQMTSSGKFLAVDDVDGGVSTEKVVAMMLSNISDGFTAALHSHPIMQAADGQTFVENFFSGSQGDMKSVLNNMKMGYQATGMIADDIVHLLDTSKISVEQMEVVLNNLQSAERELAKLAPDMFHVDDKGDIVGYNQPNTVEDAQQLSQIIYNITAQAFKKAGINFSDVYKTYDTTDDTQSDALSKHLLELANSTNQAVDPVQRLQSIIEQFAHDDGKMSQALANFKAGLISAVEAFNQSVTGNIKVRQSDVDAISTLDFGFGGGTGTGAGIASGVGAIEQVGDAAKEAEAKLESFLTLKNEILNLTSDIDVDDVGIGKYTEQLEAAKRELDALGEQGKLTADQLELVQEAFDIAQKHLSAETMNYTSYGGGGYSSSYYYEYREAEDRAEVAEANANAAEIRAEEAEKRARDAEERAADAIDDMRAYQEAYNDAANARTDAEMEAEQLRAQLNAQYEVDHLNNSAVGEDVRNQYEVERDEIEQTIRALELFKAEKLSLNDDGNIVSEDGMFYDFDGIVADIKEFGDKYGVEVDDVLHKVQQLREEISQLAQPQSVDIDLFGIDNLNNSMAGEDTRSSYELEREEIEQTIRALEVLRSAKLSFNDDGNIMSEDGMFYDFDSIISDITEFETKYGANMDAAKERVHELREELLQLAKQSEMSLLDDGQVAQEQQVNDALREQIHLEQQVVDADKPRDTSDIDTIKKETDALKEQKEVQDSIDAADEKKTKKSKSSLTPEQKWDKNLTVDGLKKYQGELRSAIKKLDFNPLDTNLTDQQKEIVNIYKSIEVELEKASKAVQKNEQVELSSIQATVSALREKIKVYKEQNNVSDSGNKKTANGISKYQNILTTIESKKNTLLNTISKDSNLVGSSVIKDKLGEYEDALNRVKTLYDKFKTAKPTDDDIIDFKSASSECNNLHRELEKLVKTYQKMHGDVSVDIPLDNFVNNATNRKQALQDYIDMMYGSKATIVDWKNEYHDLLFTINNGDGTFTEARASIDNLGTALVETQGDTKKLKGSLETFVDEVKSKFKSLSSYFTAMFGVQEVIQMVRQGIQYIKEIDTALTELKKVTNETDAAYNEFLQTASKTAKVVGSTVSDFVSATADFARLGYDIAEASNLAKAASVYKNVGDGIEDISQASESIISTMKAFGIEANNSMSIVDRFNEVGNNFAISSTGIGEAMQRSASALFEAGNTIDESIALITGANSVVQNPEQVGKRLPISIVICC